MRPSVEWEVSPYRTCAFTVVAFTLRTTRGGSPQGTAGQYDWGSEQGFGHTKQYGPPRTCCAARNERQLDQLIEAHDFGTRQAIFTRNLVLFDTG